MTILILYVLTLHYIGDFLLQNRWMAENKCKSLYALGSHVGTYTFTLGVGVAVLAAFKLVIIPMLLFYVLLNGVLHFVADFYTSRMTKKYANDGKWYGFFAVLGIDQLFHQICLISTIFLLG
jgi:hypothetical protein